MDENGSAGLDRIEPGWDVFGSDDQKIGSVQEVDEGSISVEKGLFFVKDLYVPATAVSGVDASGRRVTLNVTKDAVGDMGWTEPAVTEPGEDRQTWGQGDMTEDIAAVSERTSVTDDARGDPLLHREPVLEDGEEPDVKPGSSTEQLF